MKPEECVLFSGAAGGAEAAFGACAERFGVAEVNFTFDGHRDQRTRGIRVLTRPELAEGDVSLSYVSRLMHRKYKDTPLFRSVLQSIWHQVHNGHEIYVVGQILDDDTVKGGTGWGAELAKLHNKPLTVFDQARDAWFQWKTDAWQESPLPAIGRLRFTGTGTRFLRDNGERAIAALFERTFSADRA